MQTVNHVRAVALAATALYSVIVAQPALADEKPLRVEAAATKAATIASSDTRICSIETLTGSRVPRKVCNTAQEWKAIGVDPFIKR